MPTMLKLAHIDLFIKVTKINNGKYWVLAEDDGEYVYIRHLIDLGNDIHYGPLWSEDRNQRGEIVQEIGGIIFNKDKPEDNVPCLILQDDFLLLGCIRDNKIYLLDEDGYKTYDDLEDFIDEYDNDNMPDFTVNENTHFYLLPPTIKD